MRVRRAYYVVAGNASVDNAVRLSIDAGPGGGRVRIKKNGGEVVDLCV